MKSSCGEPYKRIAEFVTDLTAYDRVDLLITLNDTDEGMQGNLASADQLRPAAIALSSNIALA